MTFGYTVMQKIPGFIFNSIQKSLIFNFSLTYSIPNLLFSKAYLQHRKCYCLAIVKKDEQIPKLEFSAFSSVFTPMVCHNSLRCLRLAEHSHKQPREVVECASLETFRTSLDTFLENYCRELVLAGRLY